MELIAKIARVLSFVRAVRDGGKVSDVTVNPGGEANIRTDHFADSGDDSFPLDIDYCATVGDRGSKGADGFTVGYADVTSDKKAEKGEKRIYSRDADGNVVAEAWLKNDGEIVITNFAGMQTFFPDGKITNTNGTGFHTIYPDGRILSMNGNGFIDLKANGDVDINGCIINTSGNVITASGTDLDDHDHGGVEPGSGNTGPPN